MLSKSIWCYILVVPVEALPAANTVSVALNNPDGVESTFVPVPEDLPVYYVSDFPACDLAVDGAPSREALETAINDVPELSSILWTRRWNEYHPATLRANRGVVQASNWDLFPVDSLIDFYSAIDALGQYL